MACPIEFDRWSIGASFGWLALSKATCGTEEDRKHCSTQTYASHRIPALSQLQDSDCPAESKLRPWRSESRAHRSGSWRKCSSQENSDRVSNDGGGSRNQRRTSSSPCSPAG